MGRARRVGAGGDLPRALFSRCAFLSVCVSRFPICLPGCRLPVIPLQCPGSAFPVADCRLPIAAPRFDLPGCRLPSLGSAFPVADCRLPVAGCRLPSPKLIHKHYPNTRTDLTRMFGLRYACDDRPATDVAPVRSPRRVSGWCLTSAFGCPRSGTSSAGCDEIWSCCRVLTMARTSLLTTTAVATHRAE